jgi:acyl carrier protein
LTDLANPPAARHGPDMDHDARNPGLAAGMTDDPRTAEILAILAKEASVDVSALRLDATIEELGLASLDIVQAIFEIESTYNVEIPVVADRAGAEFVTVGDLVGHVLRTLDKAAPKAAPK